MRVKFLTINAREEYKTISKKVFKEEFTNKINLEARRKIKKEFQIWRKINELIFFFILYKISKLTINNPFKCYIVPPHVFFS